MVCSAMPRTVSVHVYAHVYVHVCTHVHKHITVRVVHLQPLTVGLRRTKTHRFRDRAKLGRLVYPRSLAAFGTQRLTRSLR